MEVMGIMCDPLFLWVESPPTWWGERWGHLLGRATPWGLHPPPIYRWVETSLLTHSSISHMPFGWHLPPLASWSSFTSTVLRRSPAQDLLYHHHHYVVVLLEFPRNPLLPLPNWSKGRRSSLICTCDRLRRRCPFVASSLHHDLEVGECSTTSPTRIVLVKAFGLRGWVLLKPLQVIF